MAQEDAVALGAELGRLLDDRQLIAALGARATRRVDEELALAAVGARLRDLVVGDLPPRQSGEAPLTRPRPSDL